MYVQLRVQFITTHACQSSCGRQALHTLAEANYVVQLYVLTYRITYVILVRWHVMIPIRIKVMQ